MKRNNTARLWALLLVLALICLVASAAHSRMMAPGPLWLACCRIVQAVVAQLSWPLIILVARGTLLFIFFIGFGLVVQRLWRVHRLMEELTLVAGSHSIGSHRLQTVGLCFGFMQHVVVLKTAVPLAFCFGWLTPRICVSEGLMETLTDTELRAVLLHEEYHRRHWHPLQLLLAEAVASLFFFLPVVAEWRTYFLTTTEIAADHYAERLIGRSPLAGALYKLLTHPSARQPPPEFSLMCGFSATAVRVGRLLGEAPLLAPFSHKGIFYSSLNLILVCVALQVALLPLLFC